MYQVSAQGVDERMINVHYIIIIIIIIFIHIIQSEQRVSVDSNRGNKEKHHTLSCIIKSVIVVTLNGRNNDDIVVNSGVFFPFVFRGWGK